MKVLILLQGRFPTEKAYGVTTTGTVKSLLRLGHQVTVFSLATNQDELGFNAEIDLISGGDDLLNNISSMRESKDILGRNTNRLSQLKYLIELNILDKELRFAKKL